MPKYRWCKQSFCPLLFVHFDLMRCKPICCGKSTSLNPVNFLNINIERFKGLTISSIALSGLPFSFLRFQATVHGYSRLPKPRLAALIQCISWCPVVRQPQVIHLVAALRTDCRRRYSSRLSTSETSINQHRQPKEDTEREVHCRKHETAVFDNRVPWTNKRRCGCPGCGLMRLDWPSLIQRTPGIADPDGTMFRTWV